MKFIQLEKEKRATYVKDDGPNKGFSLRDWKANLPRNKPTQNPGVFSGQSFTYIMTPNTTMLARTIVGTNQGVHRRNGRLSAGSERRWSDSCGGGTGEEAHTCSTSPGRIWTLTSNSDAAASFPIPLPQDRKYQRYCLTNPANRSKIKSNHR